MPLCYTILTFQHKQHWVNHMAKLSRILILATHITAEDIDAVQQLVAQHGGKVQQCAEKKLNAQLQQLAIAPIARACVQLVLADELADDVAFRQACLALAEQRQIDVIYQVRDDSVAYRLACFDMDSTLIAQEVIDELAKEAGVGEQVAEITERAMQGELDFQSSFKARVALLKGLNIDVLAAIAQRLTIHEGAEQLFAGLKALGFKTVILSGGFRYFAEYLQQKLGIDEVHTNHLDVQDGQVTGNVTGVIVDGERKAALLTQIAQQMGISLQQAIAVGDGANDIPMLSLAGLGVAYHAKPLVRERAKHALSYVGLDGVLYLLDMHDLSKIS